MTMTINEKDRIKASDLKVGRGLPHEKIPTEIERAILGVLKSFYEGNPSEKDQRYIDYQIRMDQAYSGLAHKELYADWIHYVLVNHHSVRADFKTFVNEYLYHLWGLGLVEAPQLKQEPFKKVHSALLEGQQPLEVINTTFTITKKGISRLKEIDQKSALREKKHNVSVVSSGLMQKFTRATEWEQLRFDFFNDLSNVEILIQGKTVGKFHYDDLGFGKRSATDTLKCVKSWELFQVLALEKGRMKYTAKNHKAKSDLSRRLKALFPHLIGQPIQADRSKEEYVTRFRTKNKADERNKYADEHLSTLDREYLGNFGQ